ncbi:hypothetical protein SUGI_0807800 [Cryptomeria japonica]|nr:hypothetical protein SUGI_0807800 [Cryptomeria japonica]
MEFSVERRAQWFSEVVCELVCCTKAIQTLLCQHVSKEAEQGSIRSVNPHIVGSYGLQGVALQGCENGGGDGMDPQENLLSNFPMNTSISSLDRGDTFLFVGTNRRVEAPMANAQI